MKHELTAKRLNEALQNTGITAQELSRRSGVNKASISQYRNGTHAPSNISAGKMAKALNVNPLWLMGFDVDKYETESSSVIKIDHTYYDLFAGVNDFAKKASKRNIDHLINYMDFIIAQQNKEDDKS